MPARSHSSLSVFGIAGLIVTIAVIVVAVSIGLTHSSPGTTTTKLVRSEPTTTATAAVPPSALSEAVLATCEADTKTVDIAVAAFEADSAVTSEPTAAAWRAALLAPTSGTLLRWPGGRYYVVSVAGDGTRRDSGDGVTPQNGDVLVTITLSGRTYDATQNPTGGCTLL